ncbi:unnamed protein product [Tetraodon nigroviridis]|uniref:(spotted green pufferfish) hypothetical protein n=1 Tax=Tetraodon nigroviridis TaxID=99883 RepID=Q4SMF7_TETNG|nr:unnamed protein product [Tetraodon nigroviridis]
MTQQEFTESLEEALSWIRGVQERLKATDNTHGPRHALEARLRETEKISHSEHEGHLKMDMALVTAENLLQSADEKLKNQTQAQLKELKSLWEETCTYITHCHSRIEWVWLHWSEYLKAIEEFEAWLSKHQRNLDVRIELQLGLKEKLWQVDQQRVALSDIHGQAGLLERLLDEAAALHNRTQDPSVEAQAQERLQEAYNDVRDRAEERLALLHRMAEEHQTFQECVKRFQSWLLTETKRLTTLMERDDSAQDKLRALQALDSSIAGEEKTLQHLESMAEMAVRNSLAGEESQVELLKSQLKELFRFSEDSRHLSDDVLAVVREHQRYADMRNDFRSNRLDRCGWWLQLLKDSVQLQERFRLLQSKDELLDSAFGPEQSDSLHQELTAAIRNRELLHSQLLQRKSRLQGLISRTKDFVEGSKLMVSKMASLRELLVAADGPRPDILAKKSQYDQFKGKVHESEEAISEHENLHDALLNMEKWLMIMRQKLESFCSPSGQWSVEGRRHEAERALGEFPEKELQLQQMEVQAQRVLEKTSVDGQVHSLQDLKRVQESWLALYDISLNLHRLLNSSAAAASEVWVVGEHLSPGTKHHHDHQMMADLSDGWGDSSPHPGRPAEVSVSSPGCGAGTERQEHCLSQAVDEEQQRARAGWEGSSTAQQEPPSASRSEGDDGPQAERGSCSSREASNPGKDSAREDEGLHPGGRKDSEHLAIAAGQHTKGGAGVCSSRRRAFQAWLSQQSDLLSSLLSNTPTPRSPQELAVQQDSLKALRAGLDWGQQQFQLLLQESPAKDAAAVSGGQVEDVGLEELRYRWMLHKSKLKDVGELRSRKASTTLRDTTKRDPAVTEKVTKKAGLLRRACRLALPLWLLLLALLLLAFLLPLMDAGSSCSLTNNFARSFNIMLRYHGPPPT